MGRAMRLDRKKASTPPSSTMTHSKAAQLTRRVFRVESTGGELALQQDQPVQARFCTHGAGVQDSPPVPPNQVSTWERYVSIFVPLQVDAVEDVSQVIGGESLQAHVFFGGFFAT